MLVIALGGFGVMVAEGTVRERNLVAALVALPFLAFAALLAWVAVSSVLRSLRIVVEPERIVIERRFAERTVAQQIVKRAEVAAVEAVQPKVDREEDDTDNRSFVRITRHGAAVIEIGRGFSLSDAEARTLAATMMREG